MKFIRHSIILFFVNLQVVGSLHEKDSELAQIIGNLVQGADLVAKVKFHEITSFEVTEILLSKSNSHSSFLASHEEKLFGSVSHIINTGVDRVSAQFPNPVIGESYIIFLKKSLDLQGIGLIRRDGNLLKLPSSANRYEYVSGVYSVLPERFSSDERNFQVCYLEIMGNEGVANFGSLSDAVRRACKFLVAEDSRERISLIVDGSSNPIFIGSLGYLEVDIHTPNDGYYTEEISREGQLVQPAYDPLDRASYISEEVYQEFVGYKLLDIHFRGETFIDVLMELKSRVLSEYNTEIFSRVDFLPEQLKSQQVEFSIGRATVADILYYLASTFVVSIERSTTRSLVVKSL